MIKMVFDEGKRLRWVEDKEEVLRELRKPGKVYVHSILDHEFPIEKQAAIEYVKFNQARLLVDDDDGYKRLETAF